MNGTRTRDSRGSYCRHAEDDGRRQIRQLFYKSGHGQLPGVSTKMGEIIINKKTRVFYRSGVTSKYEAKEEL